MLLLLCLTVPAAAQPVLSTAENDFAAALAEFDAENYSEAHTLFRRIPELLPLNRKTEAAMLMAGKALYRSGEYEACIELLTLFVQQFPSSRYLASARRTLARSRQKVSNEESRNNAIRLGVALPLNWDDRATSQHLFHGIRIAVDEQNQRGGELVQIFFRDTQNSRRGAQQAIESLIAEGVDVILGPIYSDEARSAASVAEKAGVVMVAPLATGSGIAQRHSHVFQANPPTNNRGAFMARMAVDKLDSYRLGVVSEPQDELSTRLAESFHREAERQGANVILYQTPSSFQQWVESPDLADQLSEVDALYLPIHENQDTDTRRTILEVLNQLSQLPDAPYILGGTTWNDPVLSSYAESLSVFFSDVFYVNENLKAVRSFKGSYADVSGGEEPGRLAYVGYDIARLVIGHMERGSRNALRDRILTSELYEGLGTRIQFETDRTNKQMFLLSYSAGSVRPVW